MRLAEEVILKSFQFGYFGKEIQVLQNLSDKDLMFQNRQNAQTRNEKLKQTSCSAGGWGFKPQTRPTLRVLK